MMVRPVYLFLGLWLSMASVAAAVAPAPGLVSWGSESYTLAAGESVPFEVAFDQIPVRRWVLVVESVPSGSHLNVRRARDGGLVYDGRGETRHEATIPWGTDEKISAVLTASRMGGTCTVSIWGPPGDAYRKAYGYEVNRALEAFDEGKTKRARAHLTQALADDPNDWVASKLLEGLSLGVTPSGDHGERDESVVTLPPDAPARVRTTRAAVAELRGDGRFYEALEMLQEIMDPALGTELLAAVYGDLADVFLDLNNPDQAAGALEMAQAFGLDPDSLTALKDRLDRCRF